jgi:hypothetical protein
MGADIPPAWWDSLSDGEIVARLTNDHDGAISPDLARQLAADRDHDLRARVIITVALGEDEGDASADYA